MDKRANTNNGKYFRQNYKQTTKIRPKKIIWALLLICLGLSTLVFALRSSYFEINEFSVYGNQRVSKEKVVSTSEEQSLNYWLFSLDQLRNDLMKLRWIKDIEDVSKKFPNTLEIAVVEREEVAIINHPSREDIRYTISSDMVVLNELNEQTNNFPKVTGILDDFGELNKGDKIWQGSSAEVKNVFRYINDYDITYLTEIHFDQKNSDLIELTLYFYDGSKVKLGYLEDLEDKFHTLTRLKDELLQASDEYYLDLQVPEYPVLSEFNDNTDDENNKENNKE